MAHPSPPHLMQRVRRNPPLVGRERGFSLLEVLVAFVILSLVLTMIFRLISGTLNNIKTVDGYTKALILAESTMARLGSEIPLEVGESGGDEGENLSWHLTITPFELPIDQFSEMSSSAPGEAIPLYQATVLVSWRQGSKPYSLQLNTLRVDEKREQAL